MAGLHSGLAGRTQAVRIDGLSIPVQMMLNAVSKASDAQRLMGAALLLPQEPKPPPAQNMAHIPTALHSAASVNILLAAAAALESPKDKRRREARPAARGVEVLAQMHTADVTGMSQDAALDALTQWLDAYEEPDDPDLAVIAREIELRVRVELAKHDRVV